MMCSTSHEIDRFVDELVNQLADRVASRLAEKMPKVAPTDDLLDEMAKRLCISQQTLQRMRAAGEVPFVQMGRRIAYRPEQVLAALTQNQTQGSEDV